jgi:hypothetical protein
VTDYEVEIETHYRGEPADPLRVRVQGGELDGHEQKTDGSPEFQLGERVLLFLSEAPDSEVLPEAWLALPNRVWTIDDEDRIQGDEWLDDFETLHLEAVDARIRDVLSRKSHILGTRNVPDAEAPIHVDRDSDRDPIVGTPCSFYIDFDLDPHPPVDALAWGSDLIVVGTVKEDHGPAWGEPNIIQSSGRTGRCLEIMNDYQIEIERQFRGEPIESLRIRAPGGELDGYEQLHGIAPDLEPGDRNLFFLFKAPQSDMLSEAWGFDLQRARMILPGDEIVTEHGETMTLNNLEQHIEEVLASEPPPVEERLRALWGSAKSTTFQED